MSLKIAEVLRTEDMPLVWQVTYRAYVDNGLCPQILSGRLQHCAAWDHRESYLRSNTHVFLATDEDQPVGTVSWTEDDLGGIPQDETYADLIDDFRLRHRNIRLAGSWRIATDPKYRQEQGRVKLVKLLIDACYRSMLQRGIRVCFYSFHPRHARIYVRMAGLNIISDVRQEEQFGNADSVLLYGALPSWVWENNVRVA